MNGVSLLVSAIIAVYIVDCHNLHDEPGGRNPLDEAQQASDLVRKGHQDPDSAGGTQPLKKTVNVDDSGEKYKQQKEKHLTMTNIQEPHKKEVKERKTFALERSHCRIKSICFVAGGHCVDDPALCNGRLTPQYCAGRNCQCCVPDMLDKLQSIDSKLDEMIEHQDPSLCDYISDEDCDKDEVNNQCSIKCKGDCPNFFTAIGKNCYYFSVDYEEQHTWEQSRELCKNLGDLQEMTTDLAVFDYSGQAASEEDELMQAIAKRQDVNDNINDRDVWVGAKINSEGEPFRWVQSNKELSYLYSRWHPDRPTNSNYDCLTVWVYGNAYNRAHKRGYFADAPCNSARHFVCQVFE